jgi:hypothetical protein
MRQLGQFALDKPLSLPRLLAFDSVAEVVVEKVENAILVAQFVHDRRASFFDTRNFFTELAYLAARITKMFDRIVGAALLVPEQVRGTYAIELLERAANLRQNIVLMTSLRKLLEFSIDLPQIGFEISEHALGLLDLLPQ